jgi:urea transport system ATP-binding protein
MALMALMAPMALLRIYARVAKRLAFVPHGRMIFSTMTVQENIETGQFVRSGEQVPPDLYKLVPVLEEMRARRGGRQDYRPMRTYAPTSIKRKSPATLRCDEALFPL